MLSHPRFLNLPAGELELIRERTIELARVPETHDQADAIELLEIKSRGQTFALPLTSLDGVIELQSIAHVPRAPPAIRGIVSFRGELLLGIELSALVGAAEVGIADLRRVVAVNCSNERVAILTESLVTIRSALLRSFLPDSQSRYSFITGTDLNFVSLIDPDKMVAHAFQFLRGA